MHLQCTSTKRWRENIYSRAFVNEENINQYIADNYGQFGTFWHFLALFGTAKIILIGDFPFGKHSQETMTIQASKSKKLLIIPAFIDHTILPSNLAGTDERTSRTSLKSDGHSWSVKVDAILG